MRRSQGRDHLLQLQPFFDQGLIEDVIGLIKAGKEASVYCCRAGAAARAILEAGYRPSTVTSSTDFIAGKVYRGQQYRFKNDAIYQESRARELGLRGRALRAFENRRQSSMGRQVQSGTWQHREFECLQALFEAGADVPKPIASSENAILMQYIGDEDGAAQTLNRVRLDPDEAAGLFQRVMDNNVELLLSMNMVHGDLSPHNILYWQGEIRLIDFPQVTDPRFNPHCRELLARDIENLCRYFSAYGVEANAEALTDDLWRGFTYSEF